MNRQTKKRQSKSRPIKSGFRFLVFGLNCLLLLALAAVVTYELFWAAQPVPTVAPQNSVKTEWRSIFTGKKRPVVEQDFIAEALQVDEMQDNDAFALERVLRQEGAPAAQPLDDWSEKVAYINQIALPEEDVYNFYEEKLPEEIEEKSVVYRSDDFEPAHKPEYKPPLPRIAIVIDDMGISHRRSKDISSLQYPLTASFLTYATDLAPQMAASAAAGQEIMAHLPMEPLVSMNVSPDVLTVKMSKEQIYAGLTKMLDKFPAIKGVNNHMGSRFTEDEERLAVVMQELKKRGLFFLDSKTTPRSKGLAAAQKAEVKYVARNVFLDNQDDFDYVIRQLEQTVRLAQQNGYAVAIGHPKAQTYLALKAWLPRLSARGVELVHLSEIVE